MGGNLVNRQQIGEYRIVRLLGKGGMSEVYEVEHCRLGSRHALKLFTYDADDADVQERFSVEGKLLARLSHPRIVKVTDVGTEELSGRPYFVMDLVLNARGEMQLLSDIEPGTVDEATIGRWYDDLREGLAYIHANGVVHRDLKLQNVLIGVDGHVVLTDFGISKVFDARGDGVKIVDTVQTLVKVKEGRSLVMGSVGYMAPELEMGVAASPQSDWYALGVIVYRLLTGSWCDARTDVLGTLETYDPAWTQIIPKLLHANPNGRECISYSDVRQRNRELRELADEESIMKAGAQIRLARRLVMVLAGVVVLMSGLVVYQAISYGISRKQWRAEGRQSCLYDFDDVFGIPPEAKADTQTDSQGNLLVPSREELGATQLDMLVLTHSAFAQLRAGATTVERVIADFEKMQESFSENTDNPFDAWPTGYFQAGDDATAHWMLGRATERLREFSER